jgi:hypothetical protein
MRNFGGSGAMLRELLFIGILLFAAPAWPSPSPFERTLTAADRAWFGAPLAHVLEIMDRAAARTRHGSCSIKDKAAHPEAMIRDSAVLSGKGLTPTWRVEISCTGTSDITVALDTRPFSDWTGGRRSSSDGWTVIAKGPDWILNEDRGGRPSQSFSLGVVEESSAPPPWTPIPSRARPRLISLSAWSGPQGASREHPLTELVNIDEMRALLASIPPAPLLPPHPPELPDDEGTSLQRRADELSVYSFMIARFHSPAIIIRAETSPGELAPALADELARITPEIQRSVVLNYFRDNKKRSRFPETVTLPGVRIIVPTDAEWKRFTSAPERDMFKALMDAYGTGAVVQFSQVGISRDRTQAMVYVASGGGNVFILRRDLGTWAILLELPLWES